VEAADGAFGLWRRGVRRGLGSTYGASSKIFLDPGGRGFAAEPGSARGDQPAR
jgi:hypothetical protein